jgi:hypothetical protein
MRVGVGPDIFRACRNCDLVQQRGSALEPLLFGNIGWMTRYAGPLNSDPATGGHAWLKDHPSGHEAWNFLPHRGMVYGCIPGKAQTINIEKLGAGPEDKSIDGVTMVFIARDPRSKQTRIVGWYRNATVYRNRGDITLVRKPSTAVEYQIVAKASDVTLLEPLQRAFVVPTKKAPGSLGQSLLWYGGTDEYRQRVREYIGSGGAITSVPPGKKTDGTPRQLDPEQRKKIEVAAIKHARDFYE